MNTTLSAKSKRFGKDAGIALLTTLLLLFLMSSLLVGFSVLLVSDQQLAGANNDQVKAFYAAEAGMEQMTASLGNLFSQTYSPSIGEINNLETTPPSFPGIVYQTGDGNNGYTITPNALDGYGNPAPTITTIKSGTYQGMTAMATEYTLNVNARTSTGREINLVRTTQTVGIPMFQFGIFSDTDLDFFPGPVFNFGGRTHTNGNLFLAGGSTLTLSDKVDAYKDVIRTNLENGWPTSSNYTGTVNITTSPGGNNYRALAMNEGSLVGTLGSGFNTNWPNISLGTTNYAGNLRNGQGSAFPKQSTGASQLNLGVVTIGKGATQAIDLIRRPIAGEAANITNERYFAQASLRILLSDNAADIMNLPCVDQSTQPFDLSWLAMDPGTTGTNWLNSGFRRAPRRDRLQCRRRLLAARTLSSAAKQSELCGDQGLHQDRSADRALSNDMHCRQPERRDGRSPCAWLCGPQSQPGAAVLQRHNGRGAVGAADGCDSTSGSGRLAELHPPLPKRRHNHAGANGSLSESQHKLSRHVSRPTSERGHPFGARP